MGKDPAFLMKWHCVTSYDHIVPNLPGCYAIYKYDLISHRSHLIYIGTAQNLEIRLKKHEVVRTLRALLNYPMVPMIKCKIFLTKEVRLKTEKWMIKRLKPIANYD